MSCDVPGCILHQKREEHPRDVRDLNRRMFCHEHGKFWRSKVGVVICGECHPAASEELVEERRDETDENATEAG